jgi:hypothetical protein
MDEFLKMQKNIDSLELKYDVLNSIVSIQSKQIDLLNERFNHVVDIIKIQQNYIETLKGELKDE